MGVVRRMGTQHSITWTDEQHPVLRPWIPSAEVWGGGGGGHGASLGEWEHNNNTASLIFEIIFKMSALCIACLHVRKK